MNFKFVFSALVVVALFGFQIDDANAKCRGPALKTDYWGKVSGCRCDGNADVYYVKGQKIMSSTPGKVWKCGGFSWQTTNYKWEEEDGGICTNEPAKDETGNSQLGYTMDEARKCWTLRCPTGTHLVADKDGKVDYSKCVSDSANDNVVNGVGYSVPCGGSKDTNPLTKGKKYGTEVILFNGKCMPICGREVASTTYDTSNSTHISIKINSGESEKKTVPQLQMVNPTIMQRQVLQRASVAVQ